MDATNPQGGLSRRLPVITLLLLGSGVLAASCSGWSSWLVYDRSAILSGEVWRMYTGHWVHFSTAHLAYDLVVLGIVGWIIETKPLPNFGRMCLVAPWLISGGLLLMEPQVKYYGGLSALAVTAVVYLALYGLNEAGAWSWICLSALLGLAGKTAFELITGHTLFVTGNDTVKVSVASHVLGALVALVFYGAGKLFAGKMPLGYAAKTIFPHGTESVP
ncbi:MAG TPA: rhombosortase [Candidatus Acidoferrales bacterium]|jgi:rhomboid family GlyGly-CTERM serine protease|nr:rhombosortase [Candidatus Acidoferrales bacterium]